MMLKFAVGFAMATFSSAQIIASHTGDVSPTPPPTLTTQLIPIAPTPSTCQVPWPINNHGRWTNCTAETTEPQGESCDFEKPFNFKCVYEDGPIECNKYGKFEKMDENGKSKGVNHCTLIPHPPDLLGCARHDRNFQECTSTEGCNWDGERSWCTINCRKVSCGTEFHRRDTSCQFNCPLQNATECASWQAGCGCIQDTEDKSCSAWCQNTNTADFVWLANANTDSLAPAPETKKMSVGTVMENKAPWTNEGGYSNIQLCLDACFQRGVCISPKVTV